MARAKKKRQIQPKKKKSKRKTNPQTNEPFEQDPKRRIGQFGGAGKPPKM